MEGVPEPRPGLRVLYVEDDRFWRRRGVENLGRQGIRVDAFGTAEEALEAIGGPGSQPPRAVVVLLDLNLQRGRMQGAGFLEAVAARWPEAPPPVIVLSVEDDFASILPLASRFMHSQPRVLYDYQNKRYGFSDSPDSIASSYERLAHAIHLAHLEHADGGRRFVPPFLVGISPEIRAVFRQVRLLGAAGGAATVPVMVLGSTGTGKEVVARMLHFFSQRSREPFLAVNCAAIPETLLESELFGSTKGAFTGATDREGLFEAAGMGTLFLDEIGDLGPPLQAKLLRVLEEGAVRRVGATREVEVRARVVAATNRDIAGLVADGRFREDLYYRLGMLSISLPPLAGRTQDIELLATSFILKRMPLAGRLADVDAGEVMEVLASQPWPGNVRELEGVIMKALILAGAEPDGRLTADHVREAVRSRLDPAAGLPGDRLARAEQAVADLAEAGLDDIMAGRRPPASLPEIDAEFRGLGLAWQVTRALERRLGRETGRRRRGPTDEEARRWFGYAGASSYRRWKTSR